MKPNPHHQRPTRKLLYQRRVLYTISSGEGSRNTQVVLVPAFLFANSLSFANKPRSLPDPESKAIFTAMARDEEKHYQVLRERLTAIKLRRPAGSSSG